MIPRFVRTPEDLKAARLALGLTADALALMVRVEDGRTVRRWEAGDRPIPGPVTVIMETALSFLLKKLSLEQQLDRLNSGVMTTHGAGLEEPLHDTTDTSLDQVRTGIASYEEALTTLTRRPEVESSSSRSVHWYTLRRMTPLYSPPERDDWTLPGELSPRAALLYFEKETGIRTLLVCEEGDNQAEFVLEQREPIRRQSGSSFRVQPGRVIMEFSVQAIRG